MSPKGRKQCPSCGGRGTEKIFSSSLGPKEEYKCHDCGEEWVDYSGPECTDCGSHNTKEKTRGVAPHRYSEVVCFDCGNNRRWRS